MKLNKKEKEMSIREFDAHKWAKKQKVQFTATKEKRVPVHVKFKAHDR
jgi:hypothetical protein